MTNEQITHRLLERIAVALEKMALRDVISIDEKLSLVPHKEKVALSTGRRAGKTTAANEVHQLISAYVDAFRARYGPKARPDVGGKVQGLMKTMLKDHPLPRLIALVQAFCQMDDDFFKKKCHDFPTLYCNIGKVQTALLNGTARAEDKSYWDKVFRKAYGDDKSEIQRADRTLAGDVRRAELPGGASRALPQGHREDA